MPPIPEVYGQAWIRSPDDRSDPLERRLRRVVAGLAMACALLVLVVVAVLIYWKLYLLEPSADPFRRGPFVTRLGETSAELAWTLPGKQRVEFVATAPDGTSVTGRDGRFSGLSPGPATCGRPRSAASAGRPDRFAPRRATSPRRSRSPSSATTGRAASTSGRSGARSRPSTPTSSSPPGQSYLVGAPVLLDRNIFAPLHVMRNTSSPVKRAKLTCHRLENYNCSVIHQL